VFKQKPAIEDRRLGQFLTGDSVKNSPALTQVAYVSIKALLTEELHGLIYLKHTVRYRFTVWCAFLP